jgi:2'-5' RNA ligase
MIRLFTAIPLAPSLRPPLVDLLSEMVKTKSPVKWVEPAQLHLTLRFIGDQEEAKIPAVESQLEGAVVGVEPFEIELGGVGAFPNLKHPKVLFVPVLSGQEKLSRLFTEISKGLEKVGLGLEEKPYHAHLTLGRVKTSEDVSGVIQMLQTGWPATLGKMAVDHFVLFRSQLRSQGPLYTELKKFDLKAKGI